MSGCRAHVLHVNTKRISRVFNSTFARWKLRIPGENLAREKAGFIQKEGWLVQYGFGRDEKGGYLDYYAAHRMTNDDHVRIREDGSREYLETMRELCVIPEGGDEEEARRSFYEANRRVAEALVAKGFDDRHALGDAARRPSRRQGL
jgi:hypothetical protein